MQPDLYKQPLTTPEKLSAAPQKSSRKEWIDYARGIAIFIVVYMHVANSFKNSNIAIDLTVQKFLNITSMARMPLFFVISGIYIRRSYAKRGFYKFFSYKFSTVFYPFIVWGTIQITFQLIADRFGLSHTQRSLSDYLFIIYNPHGVDQLWFLYTLFTSVMLYAALQYFFKIKVGSLLIFSGATFILFYYLPNFYLYFAIKTTCKFIFYVALGDAISKTIMNKNNFDKFSSLKIMFLLLIAYCGIKILMLKYGLTDFENDFFSIQNAMMLVSVFCGLALILNISFVLERFRLFKIIRFIGQNSLYIYIMHIILIGILRPVLLKTPLNQYPDIVLYIILILATALPIFISKFLRSHGMSYLFVAPSSGNNGELAI